MRKLIIFLIFTLLTPFFFSCEKYLDMSDSDNLTANQVFGDPVMFKKYRDGVYSYLNYWPGGYGEYTFGGFGRVGTAWFDGATDLAESSNPTSGTNCSFNVGNWSQNAYGAEVELVQPWTGAYTAIRICNVALEKVNNVPGLTTVEKNGIKGEMLFLRGFFYFELIKRYGGVPYITRSLSTNENLNFRREPYDTCVAKIVKDLDSAKLNLPIASSQGPTDFGRPTYGATLALKAKVLLYAASPLNTEPYIVANSSNDTSRYFIEVPNSVPEKQNMWVKAAMAAYDVIQTGQYSLLDADQYSDLFYGANPKNSEIIYSRVDGTYSFTQQYRVKGDMQWGQVNTAIGYGGFCGTYPTQNLIDMYEMADGSVPITGHNDDGSPIIDGSTGYDDQNMWGNRDARLKITALLNQDWWQDRNVELWYDKTDPSISGVDIKNAQGYTTTGYLEKKMWPEIIRYGFSDNTTMNWIWFRYADVLLWYAEAMNQAYGPDADGLGNGMNARTALNMVRNRFSPKGNKNLRDVKATTKEEFHERLMNERAVEFVYEEQRWWDVLRYKKGVEVFGKPIYGIKIFRTSKNPLSFEIQRYKIEDRVFYDYNHKYPIPFTEIQKCSNLKQNPGW